MAALQKMLLVKVKVRRDGQVIEVLAEGLVPGVRAYFGVVADHRA